MTRYDPYRPASARPGVLRPPALSLEQQRAQLPSWSAGRATALGLDADVGATPQTPRVAPPPALSIAEQLAQAPPWTGDRTAWLGLSDDGRCATAPRVVTPPRLSLAQQIAQLPSWRAGRAFALGIGEPDPQASLSPGLPPVLQALALLAQRAWSPAALASGAGAGGSGMGSQMMPGLLLLHLLAGLFGSRQ